MSISLLAAAAGALAAVILTGTLVARLARAPRIDVAPWPVAAFGLTVALAAQAWGFKQGFSPTSFRAVQLGAQLIAPLALLWGLAEAVGRGSGARFAARLGLSALAVVGGVILSTDPLGSTAFSKAWPAASVYYQFIPHYVLLLITAVVAVSAVAAAAVAGARSRRDERSRRLLAAVLAGAAAAVLTQGLRVSLPANSAYAALCLAAAVLAWFAGRRVSQAPSAEPYDDDWDAPERYRGYGYPDDEDEDGYGGLYREGAGGFRGRGDDTGYGFYRPDTGAFAVDTGGFGPDTGYSLYRADSQIFEAPAEDAGSFDRFYRDAGDRADPGANGDGVPGLIETGAILGVNGILPGAPPEVADPSRLYGQITIYTLREGQADEFDLLAKAAVDQVKAREPATLVYVMHGVPSAPMQRILYEVYEDADAFAEHEQQPYIREFGEDREPYVLATNVIELGVRQAKVMPLPGQRPPPAGTGHRADPGPPGGHGGRPRPAPGRRRGRPAPAGPDRDHPTPPPDGGFGGRRRGAR